MHYITFQYGLFFIWRADDLTSTSTSTSPVLVGWGVAR